MFSLLHSSSYICSYAHTSCSVCRKNRRINDLSSSFLVTMDVKKGDEILSLTVPQEVAIALHKDASADNVADYLLMLKM